MDSGRASVSSHSLDRQDSLTSNTSNTGVSVVPSPPHSVSAETPSSDHWRGQTSPTSTSTDVTKTKFTKRLKSTLTKRKEWLLIALGLRRSSPPGEPPIIEHNPSPGDETLHARFLHSHPNNPEIECGTLDECISRLVESSSESHTDQKYREIFLSTYMTFATCTKVFEGLHSRFEESDAIGDAQLRSTTRYNIMFVMKAWVTEGYVSDNSDIFRQIRGMANQIVESRHVAYTILRLAKEICRHLDSMEESPLLQTPDTQNLPRPSKLGVKDIALALTAIEGKNFERLRQADYIIHLSKTSVSESVQVAIATNEQVQYWAMHAVLRAKPLDGRVATLKFFIDIAHECHKLRNFASMAAIVKGLTSAFVQRLRQTWRDVPDNHNTMMHKMAEILEPDRYHQLLHDGDGRCVPFLDVHLRDVNYPLPNPPAVVHVGNEGLVNFSRCVDVASQLHKLKQFQVPKEVCEPGKVTYVRAQLHRIPTGASDVDLEMLCKTLEAAERIHKQMRVREWQALGLRMPDQSSQRAKVEIFF